MLFENKVAVVTGGSRGIGFATVKALVAEGATVVLCASRQETADKAVAAIREEYPNARVDAILPKLEDFNQVKEALDGVAAKYGRIDILVNNAGTSDSTKLADYTEEKFESIMNLNVKGMFNCSKVAADWMAKQGGGAIVNISSMVSRYGQPSGVAYPVSKFAVNGMTLSMARELGPKGIRVNAVAPGITETDMMKAVPKKLVDPLIAQIPLGRLGQPEDIANAVVFLASEKASYISGVVLSVDGLARS